MICVHLYIHLLFVLILLELGPIVYTQNQAPVSQATLFVCTFMNMNIDAWGFFAYDSCGPMTFIVVVIHSVLNNINIKKCSCLYGLSVGGSLNGTPRSLPDISRLRLTPSNLINITKAGHPNLLFLVLAYSNLLFIRYDHSSNFSLKANVG